MKLRLISLVAAAFLALGGLTAGLAEASNPHCRGNSDNADLPPSNGQIVKDFGGCR
jgi:hypothetical protein